MSYNQNTHKGPSFSLQNRIARMVWNVVYMLVFKYSPRPFHGWRRLVLRTFGAKVGKGVHIYPNAKIWAPWNIEVKDQAGIGDHSNLYSQGKIVIGKRAVISQGAHLCAGTHDYQSPGFELYTKPIVVGDFAWVAAEVFVHPGVSLGEGCVIGARSVVLKDMPEWTICTGFPCVAIKVRIPAEDINDFKNA